MSDQKTAPVLPSDAGADRDIEERLENDPADHDAKLDRGSDESMDASDPIAAVQPGKGTDPAPSSGYDAEAERQRSA